MGERRVGANPNANGGLLLRALKRPDCHDYAVDIPTPGTVEAEAARVMGQVLRDVMKRKIDSRKFRARRPYETASNPATIIYRPMAG